MLISGEGGAVRRINLPRPSVEQNTFNWVQQEPPHLPVFSPRQVVGNDVVFERQADDVVAMVANEEYVVLLSTVRFGLSYLTRYHWKWSIIETRVVGDDHAFSNVFFSPSGDIVVPRVDGILLVVPA